jgi:hypothetical protein
MAVSLFFDVTPAVGNFVTFQRILGVEVKTGWN